MYQVNSCYCGCTLRTGTLILTTLSLCGGILDIIHNSQAPGHVSAFHFLYVFISVIFAALALYGTLQEKPSWIVPYIIMNVIDLVICGIIMLFLPIAGTALILETNLDSDKNTADDVEGSEIAIIMFLEILLGVFFAIGCYFTIIVYSFYKQLKTGVLPGPA